MNVEILGNDAGDFTIRRSTAYPQVSVRSGLSVPVAVPKNRRRPVVYDRTQVPEAQVITSGQGYRDLDVMRTVKRRETTQGYDRKALLVRKVSPARMRLFAGYSGFGQDPGTIIAVGKTALSVGVSWHQRNVEKARAKDKENQQKAYNWLIGADTNARDRLWAIEYVLKNPSFYDPELIAMAYAWMRSDLRTGNYNDPEVQRVWLDIFNMEGARAYPENTKKDAAFIASHPEFFPAELVSRAVAFQQSGGRTMDIGEVKQTPVAVGEKQASVSMVPGVPVVTAGMLGTGLPIMLASGVVLFVVYKLFLEKKGTPKRR